MSRSGDVYLHNKLVAQITEHTNGEFEFAYNKQFLAKNPKLGVSLTLPPKPNPYKSEQLFSFFDGLIPEGWLLNHALKNWKLNYKDRMGLLLTVCQDAIGAGHVIEHGTQNQSVQNFNPTWKEQVSDQDLGLEQKCLITYGDLKPDEEFYQKKAFKELFGDFSGRPVLNFGVKELEELAATKINQRLSVTGVQKKLSLHLEGEEEGKRLTIVNFAGGHLLKPPSSDYPEMPELEHLCMTMARDFGLLVPPCGLIPMADGNLAYVVKRFDRRGKQKFYQEDFCQLLEKPTEDKYRGSLEKAAKVIQQYCHHQAPELSNYYDLNLFSFVIGNSDMHLKNYSLIQNQKTKYFQLSPCYDLLATSLLVPEDQEQTALALNGKKNKIKAEDWQAFAKTIGLPERYPDVAIKKLNRAYPKFLERIERSFIGNENKTRLKELIQSRLKTLNI